MPNSLENSDQGFFFFLPSPPLPATTIDQFSLLALRKTDNLWDKPGFRSESQYSTVTICQKKKRNSGTSKVCLPRGKQEKQAIERGLTI